jgi:hypothetical protein
MADQSAIKRDGAKVSHLSVPNPARNQTNEEVPVEVLLSTRIAALASLDRNTLLQRWAELSAHPLPPRISRELLLQAVAYQMQVKAHGGAKGGLSRWCRMQLAETGKAKASLGQQSGANGRQRQQHKGRKSPGPATRHSFKPGTRLLRTWNRETHEVIVGADGLFHYRGQTYPTLSALARTITGTRWSGPRFFGLVTSSRGRCERDG